MKDKKKKDPVGDKLSKIGNLALTSTDTPQQEVKPVEVPKVKEPTKRLTCDIPEALHQDLKILATLNKQDLSELVIELLSQYTESRKTVLTEIRK